MYEGGEKDGASLIQLGRDMSVSSPLVTSNGDAISEISSIHKGSKIESMRKNLELHPVERSSLYQDSRMLSKLMKWLYEELEYRKKYRTNWLSMTFEEKFSKTETKRLGRRIKKIEKIYLQIRDFKQMRLAELGDVSLSKSNINLINKLLRRGWRLFKRPRSGEGLFFLTPDFPHDVAREIAKTAWRNVGDSMVSGELKEVINDDTLLSHLPPIDNLDLQSGLRIDELILLQRIGFTFIDFLYKNEFCRPEVIRKLFKLPHTVHQTLVYVYYSFKTHVGLSLLDARSPYLTEHWYWPLLHGSFKALTQEEGNMINISLSIVHLRHHFERAEVYYRGSPKWISFIYSLRVGKFWTYFGARNQTDQRLDVEVDKIIDLLLMDADPHLAADNPMSKRAQLDISLVNMLDVLERYVYPGTLIKKLSIEPDLDPTKYEAFMDRYELIKLATKVEDLINQASQYIAFQKDSFTPSLYYRKDVLVYLDRLENLLPTFLQKVHLVLAKNNPTSLWLLSQPFYKLRLSAPLWLRNLKPKFS